MGKLGRKLGFKIGVHLFWMCGILVQIANAQTLIFTVNKGISTNEEQPIGTEVADVGVVYIDSSNDEYDEQYGSYSFVPGYDEQFFDISASTGVITFAAVLDIDGPNPKIVYFLTVNFTTSDGHSDTESITVQLKDINDNAPAFDQTQYLVTLPENAKVGLEVFTVIASDPDQVASEELIDEDTEMVIGINYTVTNGRVLYSIQSGNEDGQFEIHSETGNITVAAGSSIDFDEQDSYNLTILATDGGGLSNTTLVSIMILDSNDNAPVIQYPGNFNITLSEDTPPGLVINSYINTTDEDHGINEEIRYAIISGDITNSFTVDNYTGMVTLTGKLDREAQNPLKLTIAAIDQGLPQLQDVLIITINLLDVNDEAPEFQESVYSFEVDENPKVGTIVGTVHANDYDEGGGGIVTYYLEEASDDFDIDNTSGVISTASLNLDREIQAYYILTVIAVDSPTNKSLVLNSSVVVNITLLDKNDNTPQWSEPSYSAGILETESPQYVLITLRATDEDSGTNGQVKYAFSGSIDPTFTIDSDSGTVTLVGNLDFSIQSLYTYAVRAYDGAGIPKDSYTKLNITVHTPNVNPPVFAITTHNLTLSEDTAIKTVVLNVTASDKDPGLIGMIRYRISANSVFDGSGSFDVVEDTGAVFISKKLNYDYKEVKHIFFQVEAYDGGFPAPFTAHTNVTVHLTNINDEAPKIIIPIQNTPTVPENMPPNIEFADLKNFTIDEDPGDGGLFEFLLIEVFGDDYGNDSFDVTEDGILIALRTFDREEYPQGFILSIETTDFGNNSISLLNNVTVLIGDANDEIPFFESNGSALVYEFLPAGELVLANFTAVDYDIGENAELSYTIVDGDTTNSFTIDSNGTITTTKPLNKTEERYYVLTIMAIDKGPVPLYDYGEVFVEVIDLNDNAPLFNEPLIASFSENDLSGTVFYNLNATDSDEGTNSHIVYYLSDDSINNFTVYDSETNTTLVRFSVDETSGNVSMHGTFDREIESEFQLIVTAVDLGTVPGKLNTSATLTVLVDDFNDHTPVFLNDSYTFHVIENEDVGTSVGHVFAQDEDASNPNNEFIFVLDSPWGDDNVTVDENTGEIYVNGTIDWEETAVMDLVVYVVDQGEPPLSSSVNITLTIEDINDRAPEWNMTTLNLSIFENLPPSSVVGFVEAIDPDSAGNNSLVYYSMEINLNSDYFDLNQTSGEIISLVLFDREKVDIYDLIVMAFDSGTPQMSTSSTLLVEVLDRNDHNPYFLQSEYTKTISENTPNQTVIIKLQADDNDIGLNALLNYEISSPEYSFFFAINETTGKLRTNTVLDYENRTYFEFEVIVKDNGLPPRSGSVLVKISLTDYNDEAPVFNQQEYNITLVENIAIGSNILHIQSYDIDSTVTTYSIQESLASSHFEIDPTVGMIYTVDFIDREVLGSDIELVVVANNTADVINPLSSSVTVHIKILDVNDEAPQLSPYTLASIPETANNGSIVYTVAAEDGDEGVNGTVIYEITGGNEDGLFSINETSGKLYLTGSLDFENHRYHYVGVNATDQGIDPLQRYTTIIFEVTDENDHKPVFAASVYNVTILHTTVMGSTVITVSAFDQDANTIDYSIISGNDSNLFEISTSTGEISVQSSLNSFSDGIIVSMTVQASDRQYTDTAVVNIYIKGMSSNILFSSPSYTLTVMEGSNGFLKDFYGEVPDANSGTQFHIAEGNDDNVFTMMISGELKVDGSKLDFESKSFYQLSISVDLVSYAVVSIEIEDENEFHPEFSSTSFYAPVYETTKINNPFIVVLAEDKDGSSPPNKVSYTISSGNENGVFSINEGNGELSLSKRLDFDIDKHIYVLNVTAQNKESSPYYATWQLVTVELLNGNRHAPKFSTSIYSTQINEDLTEGTPIGVIVSAIDNDENQQSTVTYTLLGDHRHYDFEIDGETGNITVGPGGIDFERREYYTLIAVASDDEVPTQTSTALVSVTIVDVNDNSPVWEQLHYSASISESTDPGTTVASVLATDADQLNYLYDSENDLVTFYSKNGYVVYSITSGDPKSQFSIINDTFDRNATNVPSAVTVASILNREDISEYNLTITATDGGGRSSDAFLYISLIDENDVTPMFNDSVYYVDVSEDFEVGNLVAYVPAVDDDLSKNSQITYSIISGNVNETFSINSTTAEVLLEKKLDREVLDTYVLIVEAVDNGMAPLTGNTTLLINVVDVNEFAPEFTNHSYFASVDEDISFDHVIVKIIANDQDTGINSKIIYSISNSTVRDLFKINSSSGEISIDRELDYETHQLHYLTVSASDSAPMEKRLSTTVEVIIAILDVNDNDPQFDQKIYEASIFEDAEPLSDVLEVGATDVDSGSNAQFRFSLEFNGDGDAANNFFIDPLTGEINITNNSTLDYEQRLFYSFYVIVTDLGTPSLSTNASVIVYVQDVNDNAPSFSQNVYSGSVMENLPAGQDVLEVNSIDRDSEENGEVTYSLIEVITTEDRCLLLCPDMADKCEGNFITNTSVTETLFEIRNTTGVLSTVASFDRESLDEYIVAIMATDSSIDDDQLSSTACAVVEILDANDETPVFLNLPYTTYVTEELPTGIFVLNVSAIDHDIGTNAAITYELKEHSDNFTVNPNSGAVYTAASLDRELLVSYNITVTATDNGNETNTATAYIYVEVVDVNDSPPTFEYPQYDISINEGTSIGTVVFTAISTDADTGVNAVIQYSLVSVLPKPHFAINTTTGDLYVTQLLDRELYSEYNLTIQAVDSGIDPLKSNAVLVIDINDVNDNVPVFSKDIYSVNVSEESVPLSPIITVAASDDDIGNNSFILFSLCNSSSVFSIDETSGEIFLNEKLDAENSLSINITVIAKNMYSVPQLSSSAVVIVDITDINDHYPFFSSSQYSVAILESHPVGFLVLKVTATDFDATVENRNLSYSIVNSTNSDHFGIFKESGQIFVANELDSDVSPTVYTLTVIVDNDGLSNSTTVTITLTNVNDNPPVFVQDSYSFSLSENKAVGSAIGTVYATDADQQNISYFIFDDNEDYDKFTVDTQTGLISSNFTFDREMQETYLFNVTAVDDLDDGAYVDVPVYVTILDENDNIPVFVNESYMISVPENALTNALLVTVHAFDDDLGDSAIPLYSIESGNFSDFFRINESTGDIYLNQTLDRERDEYIEITLVATDKFNELFSSTVKLSVQVVDINDNAPIFSSSLYNATLLEDIENGTIISEVFAYDDDIENNARITFSLAEEFQGMFFINESSGVISLASPLDYELARNHSITVFASDHGSPVLQSSSNLFITVVDVNDNSPYFEHQSYSVSVSENSVPGTFVFFVPAIDIDDGLNSKLRFTILNGNIGFYFNLNEDTGIISVADYIDYELDQSFKLRVQVVDLGTPQYTAVTTINISIDDLNDNPPEFSDTIFHASLPEDASVGTIVTPLVASDKDSGSNSAITFSILSGNINSAFDIDDIGSVIVNDTLDYEERSSYSLMIVAYDGGYPSLSSMAQLIISITNVNEEAPVLYSSSYYLNVSQATAIGTTLAYLSAYDSDKDSASPLYNITASTSDSFAITAAGELYVYSSLSLGTFTLDMAVSDGANTNNVFVEIGVYAQSYSGPRFEHPTYQFNVKEGKLNSTFVGIVSVENDFDSIHFLSADQEYIQMTKVFSIDEEATIHTISQLDWEDEKYYVLNVKAIKNTFEIYTIVTINIIDVNDNPPLFDNEEYSLTLSERTPLDSAVLTFITTDIDSPGENSDITLNLKEGEEYFTIDSLTSTLTLTHDLDREVNDSIVVVVSAENSLADPLLYSTARVTVTVQDENDNSPQFEKAFYSVNAFDSAPIGSEIIKITATDEDKGMNAELVFTITYQSNPETFTINRTSGVIYTNKSLKDNVGSELSVSVTVSDRGIPTPQFDTANVFISVVKENLHSPVFDQPAGYTAAIEETANVGASIMEVTAFDKDNDSIIFTIDEDVPFTISLSTGIVKLSNQLEYLKQNFYSFTVRAIDDGFPVKNTSAIVNISVVDVNNYSPVFNSSDYSVTIFENVEVGTLVTRVEANDLDAVYIKYTITVNYQEEGVDLFRINSSTGEIFTNGHINRESIEHMELLVSAIDNGYPVQRSTSTEVFISVMDINDEYPVFSLSQYNVNVIRLTPADYPILNVTARDSDITGDQIEYAIAFQTVAGLFKIDSVTGSLQTASTVPEDVGNRTIITVSAYDGAQTSNVTVNTTIVTDGTFCEDGFCTVVVERSLDCIYVIPNFPICDAFCEIGSSLTPKHWLCIKHYCTNSALVPCQEQKECIPANEACNGMCPMGESICQPTNLCYLESTTTPCDTNTCLVGQTLVQSENGTRSCALSATLPAIGEGCTLQGYVYCTEIDTCSNLTAPHLCKLCPEGETACTDTKVCVNDTKYCCGANGYYCGVLNKCLNNGDTCRLPNIAPNITQQLIYYGTISNVFSDTGKMIGIVLGNDTELGTDSQGEEIGVAIVEVSETNATQGEWQYAECYGDISVCKECSNISSWISIEVDLSEASSLYLPNTACLRFQRRSLHIVGTSWMRVKAWDGNIDGYISTEKTMVRYQQPFTSSTVPYTLTGSVSHDSALLSALLLPINPYPVIGESNPQLTNIIENVELQKNLGDLVIDVVKSISVEQLPVLSENTIDGLPLVDGDGDSIDYTELYPTEALEQFYAEIDNANPTRSARISTNLSPSIAVQLYTEDPGSGDWQVSLNGDPQLYSYLSDIVGTTNSLLLLPTTALIRYIPKPYYSGFATLAIYPWDGVLPQSSVMHTINDFTADTASLQDFSPFSVGNMSHLSVSVIKLEQPPVITASSVLMSAIPYTMKFMYPSLFTIAVQINYDTLDMDEEDIENVLYLVLSHPVTVHRISPAANSKTHVLFSVVNNTLNISSIQEYINDQQQILDNFLPVTDLTQDAVYGAGVNCDSSSSNQGEVNGDFVYSLMSQLASDADGDYLGMAVINVNFEDGMWQYSRGNWDEAYPEDSSGIWITIPASLTEQSALLLHGSDKIRYIPKARYYWTNDEGSPSLTIKAWDNSLGNASSNMMNINTDPYTDTVQSVHKPVGSFSSSTARIFASRLSCDGNVNSGLRYDACCTCGGIGDGCKGCDGVSDSNQQPDGCGKCGSTDSTCLGCDGVPFSFSTPGSCSECISGTTDNSAIENLFISENIKDCTGTCFGSALIDSCGVCSGGSSSHSYNEDMDCFGICLGANIIDECQYCTGPDTGITYNEYLDCTGVCGGPFRADSCAICQLPDQQGSIIEHADCHGTCNGIARLDSCGICYGGLTNVVENSVIDECGICHGNNTCYGCDNILNSGKTVDNCGICGGNDCGCQKITEVISNQAPSTGGTVVTIIGSGFFLNSTNYDPTLPYCNASRTAMGGRSISATCVFRADQEEAFGAAYIEDQRTIICQTPPVTSVNEDFYISIGIENGDYTEGISFTFQSLANTDIIDMFPSKGSLNYENTVTFIGKNFLNNGLQTCLIKDKSKCLNGLTFDSKGYHAVMAEFMSDSEITCKLPTSTIPCQISLFLSFDGQQSGIIQYPQPLTETYTYMFSAPNVTSIHFSSDLTTLMIEFDRSVSISGNPSELSCSSMFSDETLQLISQSASCVWGTVWQTSVHIILPLVSNIEVGSPISFRNDAVVTKGVEFSFAITATMNVQSSVSPAIVLEGPNVISPCGHITFTVLNTHFEGYKSFSYRWSMYTLNSTITGMKDIVDYMNSLPSTASTISISSEYFQFSTVYVIEATVTNSVGETSSISKDLIKEVSSSLQVSVSSPKSQSFRPEQAFIFQAKVVNDDCANFQSFKFTWKVYRLVDERRSTYEQQSFSNLIADTSVLYIPGGLLLPLSMYRVTVTVATSDESQSATDTLYVAITDRQCRAKIHGGNRTLSIGQLLSLDGSLSEESTEGSAKYTWQCSVVGSGTPCYNASVTSTLKTLTLPLQKEVSISTSDLNPGFEYKFTLILEQDTCRSTAVTIVSVISLSADPPPAVVQILTPSLFFQQSQVVVIEGLVLSHKPVNITWECLQLEDQSYVSLSSDVLLSPKNYFAIVESEITNYKDTVWVGQTSAVNLVLRPGVLNGSSTYTFQLSAVHIDGTVTSQIAIMVDTPPQAQSFTISPLSGVELNTLFELKVERVTESIHDYPIFFQYGVVENDDVHWLSGVTSERVLYTYLPSGSPTVVVVRIYNSDGGYSHSTSLEVEVAFNNALNYDSFVDDLEDDLLSTKGWINALSSLQSMLLSIPDGESIPNIEASIVNLYSSLFNQYIPFNKANAMATLSMTELMARKLPALSANTRITLLNTVITTLDAINTLVSDNFGNIHSFSNVGGLHLSSNRYNRTSLVEGVDSQTIEALLRSANLLAADWNPELALKELQIHEKLHHILCKQTSQGEAVASVEFNGNEFNFVKGVPIGMIETSSKLAYVELNDGFLQLYNKLACIDSNYAACTEACIQLATLTNDYFAPSNNNVVLSQNAEQFISSNIAGSDLESVSLISEIVSFDLSTPNTDGYITVSNDINIKVHLPITTLRPNGSIPLCMYRSISGSMLGEWQVDSLIPPLETIANGNEYYVCDYNHLSQFVIGLLPPPVVAPSSSSIYLSSSPILQLSSSPVESVRPSPTPIMPTVERVSNSAQVIGGVVSSLLIVLLIVVALILVFGVVWWKKVKTRKNKVVPKPEPPEVSEKSLLAQESIRSQTPEPSKITLGVIQLTRSGERSVLGSLDVSLSTRLRELRNLLSENFPQLKKISFYLCNKELSDIEPATEQQQFVSLVYGSIAYVREVDSNNPNIKKQFCICKKVAQFECSKCSQRGYCSKECQDQDWEINHKKECSRVVEKRNRSEILLQRQASSRSIEEGGTVSPHQRQSVTSWNEFLHQSRSYRSSSIRSPTKTTLPAITSQPKLPTVSESDETLRQELDSTEQILLPPAKTSPPVRTIPPPSTLPRLASHTTVGQLASTVNRPRALSLSPPTPLLSRPSGVLKPQFSRVSLPTTQGFEQSTPFQQQPLFGGGPLNNQQTSLQLQSPQNMQLPVFTRPSFQRTTLKPQLNQRISVTSIQSDILSPQASIRQEPKLEENATLEDTNKQEDNDSNSETNRTSDRPPSLARRRRNSRAVSQGSSDSQSSSDLSDSTLSTSDDDQ